MPSRTKPVARAGLAAGIWLCVALMSACGRPGAGRPARNLAELQRNFAFAPGIEVHAAAGAELERAAELLAARSGRAVTVVGANEAGESDRARVVIGRFDDPGIGALVGRVAPERGDEGRRLLFGQRFAGASDALFACFRDPERPGLPMFLIAAGSDEALARCVDDLRFPARPGARLFVDGAPWLEVELALSGAPRPVTLVELGPARRAARRALVRVKRIQDPGIAAQRVDVIPDTAAATYLSIVRAVRHALVTRRGLDAADSPFVVELVQEPADALALAGRVAPITPGLLGLPDTALLARGVPHDGGALAARELLISSLGPPVAAWMADGAALDASDRWWGERLEREAGGPARSVPALATIVDPAAIDHVSVHALAPARALFHRFLRLREGEDFLRELWRGERELELDEALEAEFRAFAQPVEVAPTKTLRPLPGADAFLGGVVIDTALRPGGALAGPDLERELARAVAAGARAVSFVSMYYERAPAPDFGGNPVESGRESVEGDAAIAAAVASARAAGVEVVALAPRLLLSDSAGFASQRRRQTRADWADFFDAYDGMLAHYATLAQLSGCDLLVIGTEDIAHYGEAGRDEAVEAYVRERWSAAIARARALFGGALTYAARHPQELSAVPFWDQLDAVGATFFPELSEPGGVRASDKLATNRMRAQLEHLVAFADERGLPALVLEAGFRATRDASVESAVGPGPADEAEQARLYEALARALVVSRRESNGPAGLFLWRWEATGDGGPRDRSFAPQGKPAESLLPGLFGAE